MDEDVVCVEEWVGGGVGEVVVAVAARDGWRVMSGGWRRLRINS